MTLNQPFVKSLLILALLFTVLNAFKPLCIDDTVYQYHAHQIAEHPLHPYGFRLFWYDRPQPAVQVLAPVMMQYWWAIAIRIFGEHPLMWKLWMFPYALLLVFALHSLLRRFADRYATLLMWLTVISPVFLPSFNLMHDVPVTALTLCAIVIFLRGSESNCYGLIALSGLIAGIAGQTKYTGLIGPVVMMLYALIFRKAWLGIFAAAIAGTFFLLWEIFIFLSSGQSHFLAQAHTFGSVHLLAKYAYLAWPLVTIMGAVGPAILLLALAALRASKRVILMCAGSLILGYLLIAVLPAGYQVLAASPRRPQELFTLPGLIFSAYGMAFTATMGAVIWRLTRIGKGVSAGVRQWRRFREEWFLTGWLVIEIVAYFGLSPFPAVRRVLGLTVVLTLITGRFAARTARAPQTRSLVRKIVFGGMALGLLFYAVDFRDAYVEKIAAEKAAQNISDQILISRSQISDPGSQSLVNQKVTAWYVARWGFQYYAERAGMKPVLPDESNFRQGDLVAISDGPYLTKPLTQHLSRYRLEPITELVFGDRFPLATMLGYYNTGIPIHHQAGPRRVVRIYRIVGQSAQP